MSDPSLPNLHGDDPRPLGGDIAGPGGPYDRDAVVVDTTNAVIMDYSEVSIVHLGRRNGPSEAAVALRLDGRINRTADRTRVLYILNGDGVAALITELLGVVKRAEKAGAPELANELRSRLGERWDEMPT